MAECPSVEVGANTRTRGCQREGERFQTAFPNGQKKAAALILVQTEAAEKLCCTRLRKNGPMIENDHGIEAAQYADEVQYFQLQRGYGSLEQFCLRLS
jgi:hypothetical protein